MASPSSIDPGGSPFRRIRGTNFREPPRESWRPRILEPASTFFSETVWSESRPKQGPRALLYRVCRIGHLCVRGFLRDDIVFRACALTYITVLSLVPLLAFSFSVAKGFGFYEPLV